MSITRWAVGFRCAIDHPARFRRFARAQPATASGPSRESRSAMKIAILAGGRGSRLAEETDVKSKAMVPIGDEPVLWHIMRYYAHFGFKDFILCLGYQAEYIKNYFLNYNEYLANDFTLANGGKDLTLYNKDMEDWNITFADTGARACVGESLRAVKKYL